MCRQASRTIRLCDNRRLWLAKFDGVARRLRERHHSIWSNQRPQALGTNETPGWRLLIAMVCFVPVSQPGAFSFSLLFSFFTSTSTSTSHSRGRPLPLTFAPLTFTMGYANGPAVALETTDSYPPRVLREFHPRFPKPQICHPSMDFIHAQETTVELPKMSNPLVATLHEDGSDIHLAMADCSSTIDRYPCLPLLCRIYLTWALQAICERLVLLWIDIFGTLRVSLSALLRRARLNNVETVHLPLKLLAARLACPGIRNRIHICSMGRLGSSSIQHALQPVSTAIANCGMNAA
jgi:hypothetical protein